MQSIERPNWFAASWFAQFMSSGLGRRARIVAGFGLIALGLVVIGGGAGVAVAVVGLVPLAVFWIFVTWLIVLFGLEVTYTTQHLSTLDAADMAAARETDKRFIANDITAINVVRAIAEAFEQSTGPLETEALYGALDLPPEFGRKMLDRLVEKGIVVKTSDPRAGYIPARDPSKIKLSEIAVAVAEAGFAQSMREGGDKLDKYSVRQILKDERQSTRSVRQKTPARKQPETKGAPDASSEQIEGPQPPAML